MAIEKITNPAAAASAYSPPTSGSHRFGSSFAAGLMDSKTDATDLVAGMPGSSWLERQRAAPLSWPPSPP